MNKRKIGEDAEERAATYLRDRKVKILARNFYTRSGELDIVGTDGDYLVFFEVKYREDLSCGDPLEAVTGEKIRRIIKTARFFMHKNGISEDTLIRFDVVAITGDTIKWLKNAFECT